MSDLIPQGEQVEKIVDIIESAKERAYRKVNEKLADFFATDYPDLKGFNRRGLYRMKQFYELSAALLIREICGILYMKVATQMSKVRGECND